MFTPQDPSAFQSWMLAIPSAITAISTWYINRKTVKTSEKAHTKNEELVNGATEGIINRIRLLEDRMLKVEDQIEKTRNCQLVLAQKHTDSHAETLVELKNAREVLQRFKALQDNRKVQAAPAPAQTPKPDDNGKVTVVETAVPNIGKVIVKP